MNYPIVNNKETFKGTEFYLESNSFKNWFVAPANNSWIYNNNPISVGGRTIINARKEYIVNGDLINEFSTSKGGVSVIPISINEYANKLELNFSFQTEHQIKLDVLNSLPYPSLIFSATLLNSAADFDSLLQEITNKIKSNSLLKGELRMSFQGVKIINKSSVVYNLRKSILSLSEKLKGKEATKFNFYKEVYEFINLNFSSIVNTDFSPLSNIEKDKLIDYLCTKFSDSFISVKTHETYFDGALTFEKIQLREPLEIEDKDLKNIFQNTNLVTETFHLQ